MPCYILFKSRCDYYQIWADRKLDKVNQCTKNNKTDMFQDLETPTTFYIHHSGFIPRDMVDDIQSKVVVGDPGFEEKYEYQPKTLKKV